MSKCRSCGANIRWAKTGRGKMMPIDPEPNDEGNLQLVPQPAVDGKPQPPLAVVNRNALNRYISHFATCPHAAAHRGDRRRRKDIDD